MSYSNSAIEAQNLNLTWELMLANVDQDLKASVIAEVTRYVRSNVDAAHSGPMAFYIIANRIVRSSEDTSPMTSGGKAFTYVGVVLNPLPTFLMALSLVAL